MARPPGEQASQSVPQRQEPGARGAVTFVGVAFAWSWGFLLTAVALDARAGHPLHLIGLVGPVVALACVLRWHTDARYRRHLLARSLDVRRVSRRSWWSVLAVGAGLPVAALLLVRAVGGETTSDLGLAVAPVTGAIAFAVVAGLGEEPGWRGLAQDGAVTYLSPLSSAVVLGVLWSVWHLPLHLVDGTFQADLGWGTEQDRQRDAREHRRPERATLLVPGARGSRAREL